jgi:hypothetical protein
MKVTTPIGVLLAASLLAGAGVQAQQPIIYPAKGQTPDQQNKDQGECAAWAKQTTGVDPLAVAQQGASAPTASGPQGERAKGAVGGAAAGAVIGAIAGDTGKGAAIGAATGVIAGGARQRRTAQAQGQQQQAQQQQSQAALSTYTRAYSACLEGRGYTIK